MVVLRLHCRHHKSEDRENQRDEGGDVRPVDPLVVDLEAEARLPASTLDIVKDARRHADRHVPGAHRLNAFHTELFHPLTEDRAHDQEAKDHRHARPWLSAEGQTKAIVFAADFAV